MPWSLICLGVWTMLGGANFPAYNCGYVLRQDFNLWLSGRIFWLLRRSGVWYPLTVDDPCFFLFTSATGRIAVHTAPKYGRKSLSICDAPLSRSAWHGFAASQYGLILVVAQKLSGVVWTPIRCVTLHFRDRRSFAPLQKSRRHNRSCLWTNSPSRRIFEVAQKLSSIVWTPIRYVTLHFRDRRGAASLRHGNRAATTVLVCEQKPYSVWFSWRRKSYQV